LTRVVTLQVYVLMDGYVWQVAMTRPPRPLASVVLEGDVAETVVADLKNFFASQAWYQVRHERRLVRDVRDEQERGIPWRRGVLLHGPPGTGKVRE
jgi:chaperone BCS1